MAVKEFRAGSGCFSDARSTLESLKSVVISTFLFINLSCVCW